MNSFDEGLPFILRYENIAWYDDGEVRILDRRVYPHRTVFVICRSHIEVMQAIRDMVTQSAGPYTAAPMGMALAAYECRNLDRTAQYEYLTKAASTIADARPTTRQRMLILIEGCLEAARKALDEDKRVDLAIRDHVIEANNHRYEKIYRTACHLTDLIPDGAGIMTQCYADTVLGMMLREFRRRNMKVSFFCPETRPYLQGARLTASVCSEMGFDTTLITDNMCAFVMANERIDVFTCAADAICCDGYVFNKVGTSQIAILAKHYNIPVYVTGDPDIGHPSWDTVTIEMRNPDETLHAMGKRTAALNANIKGYYPAFDMTPPSLITKIITSLGPFNASEVSQYFENGGQGEYK